MRYTAYINDNEFFDTALISDSYALSAAEVTEEYGGAGEFNFSIPPRNNYFGQFRKLKDLVSVERDGEEIFYGRVYSISSEFNTVQSVECEGILAAFNDTLITPFTNEDSLQALLEEFISQHNAASDIQFQLGNIEIEDDYCYRAYENYESTWSRLSDLVDSYGGYFKARREDGVLYLDWYAAEIAECGQYIELGSNLLDITQESESSEIITALIPFGADYTDDDGNEYTTDITSVNDGVNYIYDADAVEEFGWIWGTYTWDDVTEPANLLSNAQEYLAEYCYSKVTINVTAVDLANAGLSLYHFDVGNNIWVSSSPHGINDVFLCTEKTYDLLDPSQDSLTLGEEIKGYIASADQTSTISRITMLETVASDINKTTTALTKTVEVASEDYAELEERIDALEDEISALKSALNGVTVLEVE